MILLIVALDTDRLTRTEVHLHLRGRKRQPLAAAEIIRVPDQSSSGEEILGAAAKAVAGVEEEKRK